MILYSLFVELFNQKEVFFFTLAQNVGGMVRSLWCACGKLCTMTVCCGALLSQSNCIMILEAFDMHYHTSQPF
jgi:hypothetical protein